MNARAAVLLVATLLVGCREPVGRASPTSVIAGDVDVSGEPLRIERAGGDAVHVTLDRRWTRLDGLDGVELLGLPPDWTAVAIGDELRVAPGATGEMPWPRSPYAAPFLWTVMMAMFWLLALARRDGAGAIAIMHLVGFLIFATSEGWAWCLHLASAVVLLAISPFVRGRSALAIGLASAAQLAMISLALLGPERAPAASWVGHDAIEVDAGPSRRDVALIADDGAVLLETQATPGGYRLVVIWIDDRAPRAVRVDGELVRLGPRPAAGGYDRLSSRHGRAHRAALSRR